jgi:hypothetical protein
VCRQRRVELFQRLVDGKTSRLVKVRHAAECAGAGEEMSSPAADERAARLRFLAREAELTSQPSAGGRRD